MIGPGILWASVAQSPKSINLQRSLQNGLNFSSLTQRTGFLQQGQGTVVMEFEFAITTCNGSA